MDVNAFLMVQKGPPHRQGDTLPLNLSKMLIGRVWQEQIPDICFDDLLISRKHAEISYDNGNFFLVDLPSSKHGTEINGKELAKAVPYVLRHNDHISLAKGAVVLSFCCPDQMGQTIDIRDYIGGGEQVTAERKPTCEPIVVDEERREVLLDGKELRPRIPGREFELIILLYRNRGKAVSHEAIIEWVWRNVQNRDTLTHQDVVTLVHRLRKCLGEYGKRIENIAPYGYRLD